MSQLDSFSLQILEALRGMNDDPMHPVDIAYLMSFFRWLPKRAVKAKVIRLMELDLVRFYKDMDLVALTFTGLNYLIGLGVHTPQPAAGSEVK